MLPADSPVEQHDAVPQHKVIVEKEEMDAEVEQVKGEPVDGVFSEYGRFDTYAPSAAGARLVSRVASPRTAANLVAITPVRAYAPVVLTQNPNSMKVRRSRRLPASSQAAPQTPSMNAAVIIPNLHVATPNAKSAKMPKNKK